MFAIAEYARLIVLSLDGLSDTTGAEISGESCSRENVAEIQGGRFGTTPSLHGNPTPSGGDCTFAIAEYARLRVSSLDGLSDTTGGEILGECCSKGNVAEIQWGRSGTTSSYHGNPLLDSRFSPPYVGVTFTTGSNGGTYVTGCECDDCEDEVVAAGCVTLAEEVLS